MKLFTPYTIPQKKIAIFSGLTNKTKETEIL
jgi:hypothetical protein